MIALKLLCFVALCATIFPHAHSMGKIVGGSESTIEKLPYMASLQFHVGTLIIHRCAGSIISTKYLLSSANCVPESLDIFYARVGSTAYDSGGQLLKIDSFVIHPEYKRETFEYDASVFSFANSEEIILGPNVAIVELSSGENPGDWTILTVSGWGVEQETDVDMSINLKEIDLPVFPSQRCDIFYNGIITWAHICIGGTENWNESACHGDSGGPAVVYEVQYGIIAGGMSCSYPRIPGIYTRVSEVREWITDVTGI